VGRRRQKEGSGNGASQGNRWLKTQAQEEGQVIDEGKRCEISAALGLEGQKKKEGTKNREEKVPKLFKKRDRKFNSNRKQN